MKQKGNKKDFENKIKKNLDRRVAILKTVVNFVTSTRRFKNTFGL